MSDAATPAADARAFWSALFGDDAPVEIEIGCGDGAFLLARAPAAPRRNLLGIERAPRKAQRLAARVARLGAPHVRTLRADAACVLTLVPPASVHAYHVYFPDPWPKRRHGRRRLFTPAFVRALARTLVAGGELYVATDVGSYMATIRATVLASGTFAERAPGDDHPGLATAFARKYRAEGRALHLARFARAPERVGVGGRRRPTDGTDRGVPDGATAVRPTASDAAQPRAESAASKIRSS